MKVTNFNTPTFKPTMVSPTTMVPNLVDDEFPDAGAYEEIVPPINEETLKVSNFILKKKFPFWTLGTIISAEQQVFLYINQSTTLSRQIYKNLELNMYAFSCLFFYFLLLTTSSPYFLIAIHG